SAEDGKLALAANRGECELGKRFRLRADPQHSQGVRLGQAGADFIVFGQLIAARQRANAEQSSGPSIDWEKQTFLAAGREGQFANRGERPVEAHFDFRLDVRGAGRVELDKGFALA